MPAVPGLNVSVPFRFVRHPDRNRVEVLQWFEAPGRASLYRRSPDEFKDECALKGESPLTKGSIRNAYTHE